MSSKTAGFTILEMATVLLIVAILVTMAVPVVKRFEERADRMKCSGNLRSLFVGASSYVVDHGHWPQVPSDLMRDYPNQFADLWIDALKPYHLDRVNWICPSIQRISLDPDYKEPSNHRIDYLATPFDTNALTPYRWSKQPWFVERGDVHGNGNLLIFSDGSVVALKEVR